MQRKYYFMAVLLIASAIFISGCGKKTVSQPAVDNKPIDNQQNVTQNQEQGANQDQNQAEPQASEAVNPSGSYSINELFAMNRPMKCTWKESATGDKDVSNIMYIHNKNFYQDVTMGDVGHSFMIYNGDYLYIWNSFNDMASKMKNTQSQTGLDQGQAKPKDDAGLDQKKDFVCEDWTADDSIFIPPADKNFKDVTEEMNQAVQEMKNGGLDNSKKQICDSCNQAPTQELKDKCRSNAKCD
jgi:hypothetical protein